jgi:hypothetical protein
MADDILQEAKELFSEAEKTLSDQRKQAEEDICFGRLGRQWDERVELQRNQEGRPSLVINMLPRYVHSIVNAGRKAKPGVQVLPVDNSGDKEKAQVIAGLIRAIERNSNAEVAYDTALDNAVSCGFGFFRIGIDYAYEESFEMCAKIERVPSSLQVLWDTASARFDASDWNYAFITDHLAKRDFEARYPKMKDASFESDDGWCENDTVRVAEYWRRREMEREIHQLTDGRVIRADSLPAMGRALSGGDDGGKDSEYAALAMQALRGGGVDIVRTRKAKFHKVERVLVSGADVLDEVELWPGSMIPICPVWGEEVFHGGKRHFISLTRAMMDSQKIYNYSRSTATELTSLAPRAPFIAEKGAIHPNDFEDWRTANNRSHAVLEYMPGHQRPTREPFSGVPAGAINEAMISVDEMKSVSGIYDAALGKQSNETSGVAIGQRKMQSETANFHFLDNLSHAIRYCGQCLVEIIPHVYSERETLNILGEDMKDKVVKMRGDGKIYDLSVGKYDVTVRAGSAFETQREEARETMLEIMKTVPQSAPLVADMLMEHLDIPQADKISGRLRAMLPPQIAMAEAQGEDIPAAASAAISAMRRQMGEMQNELKKAGAELADLRTKAASEAGKLEIDRRKVTLDEQKFEYEKTRDLVQAMGEANAGDMLRILPALEELRGMTSALAEHQAAPVSIIRDPGTGAITAVRKGGAVLRVVRNENGAIETLQ